MWQIIIVIVVGICTVIYVGYRIYRLITDIRHDDNPCAGCSGCVLKDQINNKKDCPEAK